jgi:leader peptidase (prepilin peptidase)/N-methyltransferase
MALPVLALHLLSPASMGFGDVKAAVVLGAAVGTVDARLAAVALCLAAAGGAAFGLASLVVLLANNAIVAAIFTGDGPS